MRKTFQLIGLISLACFSFFVTEKTTVAVSNMDDLMIRIKEEKKYFKSDPVDATIIDNNIIPGIKGKSVNEKKSYKNMKLNGYYNEKLYVYNFTKPKISLEDNKDKFIIKGNPNKKMVSLIFILKDNDDILDILDTLNNYNIGATFFVNPNWFINNINILELATLKGHSIGLYLDDYKDEDYEWMSTSIKKLNSSKKNFCYNSNLDIDGLNECSNKGDYTISPKEISSNTPLVDIKNNLENGSLLSLKINNELKKELSTIIIYIKSKGYTIANIENHILE